MLTTCDHLAPKTAEYLQRSDAERIDYVRRVKWIDYPVAANILAELEDLMDYPPRARMPCRLIIGDSNNGKTELLARLLKRHPPDLNLEGEAVHIPVLSVVARRVDERALHESMLEKLFEQITPRSTLIDLQSQTVAVLNRIRPKLIVVDEANEFITGSTNKSAACLSALKYISNSTRIPIVAVGTIEALNAFKTDAQIENRFEPIFIPRWNLDGAYRGLLKSFEKILPLKKPSQLYSRELSKCIHSKSGGTIGETSSLLSKSAVYAIKHGVEQITKEVIDSSGYRPVAERLSPPRV